MPLSVKKWIHSDIIQQFLIKWSLLVLVLYKILKHFKKIKKNKKIKKLGFHLYYIIQSNTQKKSV